MAMNAKQAAEKWNISDRRVRTLCVNGQIEVLIVSARFGIFLTAQINPKTEELKLKKV